MKFKRFLFTLALFSVLHDSMAINTISGVSNNLFEGTNLLTKFFWAGCIFAGVFLLTAAMTNYKEHRNNPKLIPISTVIVYIILGLFIIMIPFLNRLFGSDGYDISIGSVYINKH